MKLLITLSIAFLILSGFALIGPRSSFAATNNNNSHNSNNEHNDNRDNKDNKDFNDCSKHPERSECHVSVPEFGVIPGIIAAVSSTGTFVYLKKKKYN
jgi:hypothetical protein